MAVISLRTNDTHRLLLVIKLFLLLSPNLLSVIVSRLLQHLVEKLKLAYPLSSDRPVLSVQQTLELLRLTTHAALRCTPRIVTFPHVG